MFKDLQHAIRLLWQSRGWTTVVVLSLALGIGANAAIFSLFNQMLLRALPVREPAQLVNLSAPGPKPGSQSCNNAGDCDDVFSYPMFRDLEKAQTGFAGVAAHRLFGASLSAQGQTMSGDGMLVSGSYFSVLGLRPALGRLLGPDDDRYDASGDADHDVERGGPLGFGELVRLAGESEADEPIDPDLDLVLHEPRQRSQVHFTAHGERCDEDRQDAGETHDSIQSPSSAVS